MATMVWSIMWYLGAFYTLNTLRSMNRKLTFLVEWVENYEFNKEGLSKDNRGTIQK